MEQPVVEPASEVSNPDNPQEYRPTDQVDEILAEIPIDREDTPEIQHETQRTRKEALDEEENPGNQYRTQRISGQETQTIHPQTKKGTAKGM